MNAERAAWAEVLRMEKQALTRARRLHAKAYAFHKAHPTPESEQALEWARDYLQLFERGGER